MPIDTSSHKEKAKLAVERRNYPYAIELYQEILQLTPNDVEARRSLRAVEIRQAKEAGGSRAGAIFKNLGTFLKLSLPSGNHEQVMIDCEKYLASDPTNPRMLKKLANAAFGAGYRETAAAVLEDMREQHPHDIEGMRMLQTVYRETGELKKALDINRAILRTEPGDREANQAIRDLSASDMSEKFAAAAQAGERGGASQALIKDDREVERQRREELRTEDDVLAEIEDVKKDIAEKPEDSRLQVKLGNLNLRLKKFDDAQGAFAKAKELSPTEYTIDMKLQDVDIARVREDAGKLAKVWQADRGNMEKRQAYSRAYHKLLDLRLNYFTEREQQFPTDLNIAYELGNIFYEKKSHDEAIKRYQRTIHDPKNRSQSLLNLGICFQRKGQFDLAVKQFSEGIQFNEIWNDMRKNLVYQRADCFEQMHQDAKAKEDFTAIYEKDIAFRDIGKRLERLQKE